MERKGYVKKMAKEGTGKQARKLLLELLVQEEYSIERKWTGLGWPLPTPLLVRNHGKWTEYCNGNQGVWLWWKGWLMERDGKDGRPFLACLLAFFHLLLYHSSHNHRPLLPRSRTISISILNDSSIHQQRHLGKAVRNWQWRLERVGAVVVRGKGNGNGKAANGKKERKKRSILSSQEEADEEELEGVNPIQFTSIRLNTPVLILILIREL